MKCLILIFLISFSTYGQIDINEYFNYRSVLSRGDTVRFTYKEAKQAIQLVFILLMTTSAYGQSGPIIIGDKGHVPMVDTEAPSIPTGIQATVVSDDSILWTWIPPPEEDFYKVYVKLDGALEDSTINDTIIFGGFSPNTFHYVHLASEDNNYNLSSYSDSVCATTLDTEVDPGVAPEIPTQLTADSSGAITLSWVNNPPNATRIIIQRTQADYDTVLYPINTWTDPNALEGFYYPYRIYAENDGGSSDTTAEVTTELVNDSTVYFSTTGIAGNSWLNPNIPKPYSSFNTITHQQGWYYRFKCGDTISSGGIVMANSGSSGNEITLGNYGDTASGLPVISLKEELPGWDTEESWSLYGEEIYHVWKFVLPSGTYSIRHGIWLDGKWYKRTHKIIWPVDNYPFDSLAIDRLDDNTYPGIDDEYRWFQKYDYTELYVYSLTNPATAYSMIEIPLKSGSSSPSYIYNIYMNGKDYWIIDGIQFCGGYVNIKMIGSQHNIIRNCISYHCTQQFVRMEPSGSRGGDYNEIYNNILDSKQTDFVDGPYDYYSNSATGGSHLTNMQGIVMTQGASYNKVHNNTITDFYNTSVVYGGEPTDAFPTSHNIIYENICYNTGRCGRGIGSNGTNNSGSKSTGNIVVNNIMYQEMGGTIGGDSTIWAFNLYPNNKATAPALYLSWGQAGEIKQSYGYIGYNTVNQTNIYALTAFSGIASGWCENNLFINCDQDWSGLRAVRDDDGSWNSNANWRNNIVFYQGRDSSDDIVYYQSQNLTMPEWNLADADGDVVSGNQQWTGTLTDLIDTTNFVVPGGSLAEDGSTTMPAWVRTYLIQAFPDGFYSRDGTLIINSGGTQVSFRRGAGGE